jgi:CheY-like chemotaxis protein
MYPHKPRKIKDKGNLTMIPIRYIDWNSEDREARLSLLRKFGYEVDATPFNSQSMAEMKSNLPQAVVIAVDRRPSQGREIAMYLRKTKATRLVPLVLVGGDEEKVNLIREHLPDAVYTTWENIETDLKRAIDNPKPDPVVPRSLFDPYRGRPLPKKLGIKPSSRVGLMDAPADFSQTLGELPEDVHLVHQPQHACDIVIWFVTQHQEFEKRLLTTARLVKNGAVWIVWPKKTSGVSSDLSQPIVRAAGLAAGLVDYKVCSVDQTWTGLCFRWRKG